MADKLKYVWGPESKYHVAVQHDGTMLTNERCNLDDVHGEKHVEDQLPPDIDHASLCRSCFPPAAVVDPEPATS